MPVCTKTALFYFCYSPIITNIVPTYLRSPILRGAEAHNDLMHVGLNLLSDTSEKLSTPTLSRALKYLLAMVARSSNKTESDAASALGRLGLQLVAEISAGPAHKRSKDLSAALVSLSVQSLSRREAGELLWALNQLLSATTENAGVEVVPRTMATALSKLQSSLSTVAGCTSGDDGLEDLVTAPQQADIQKLIASARDRLEVFSGWVLGI